MRLSWAIVAAVMLAGVPSSFASDTTAALILIPIGGGIIGLVVGAIICAIARLTKRANRVIWFSLPVFALIGTGIAVGAVNSKTSAYEDKIVASFGTYDHQRGGMGVLQVPADFSPTDLREFYGLLTNRENAVLSSHEFATALVRQGNGTTQVYLNVYPDLNSTNGEYSVVNGEVQRQLDSLLKKRAASPDRQK